MQLISKRIVSLLESDANLKFAVTRGVIHKYPNQDSAIGYKITPSGVSMAVGNIKSEKSFKGKDGNQKTDRLILRFTAFGDMADELSAVQEGQELIILTERSKSKSGDKWYDNDNVIAFEVL